MLAFDSNIGLAAAGTASPARGAEHGTAPLNSLATRNRVVASTQNQSHETVVQPAARNAVLAPGISTGATCHTFHRSFATHLPEYGSDIHTVQELLGHKDAATTMLHTHVLPRGSPGLQDSAGRLPGDLP